MAKKIAVCVVRCLCLCKRVLKAINLPINNLHTSHIFLFFPLTSSWFGERKWQSKIESFKDIHKARKKKSFFSRCESAKNEKEIFPSSSFLLVLLLVINEKWKKRKTDADKKSRSRFWFSSYVIVMRFKGCVLKGFFLILKEMFFVILFPTR